MVMRPDTIKFWKELVPVTGMDFGYPFYNDEFIREIQPVFITLLGNDSGVPEYLKSTLVGASWGYTSFYESDDMSLTEDKKTRYYNVELGDLKFLPNYEDASAYCLIWTKPNQVIRPIRGFVSTNYEQDYFNVAAVTRNGKPMFVNNWRDLLLKMQ